jgi:hypothetical protein
MSDKYPKNYVLILIIFIIIFLAIIIFMFFSPGPSIPHDNKISDICKEGQCSIPSTQDFPEDNLTDTQKKLSTDLLQLIGIINLPDGMTKDNLELQMIQNHQLKWVDDTGAPTNGIIGHKLVYVYITTSENADLDLLKGNIWNISNADPAFNLIVAWVDVDNLTNLASIDSVKSIRTVLPPRTIM